ncbi:RNA polymerase sigma factor [Streptomyces tauricus]|uniref:RNA polymerase sigma factor n=1 Tax=Streptomyces tauricus TaxID=68274 RepID=UPI003803EF34
MAPDKLSRGGPPGEKYDPAAFEVFYRRHVDAVTRFMARRVTDPHTVADLTAETFLSVIDSARAYRPDLGTEVAWLFGIARNVVAAEARRSARQTALGGRIAGRRLLDGDDIGRLEEKLDAEQAGRRALAALGCLPAGERAVIELVAVDQLTVTEAAEALGIRRVTARVRLHRARRALRSAATGTEATAQGPAASHPAGAPGTRRASDVSAVDQSGLTYAGGEA